MQWKFAPTSSAAKHRVAFLGFFCELFRVRPGIRTCQTEILMIIPMSHEVTFSIYNRIDVSGTTYMYVLEGNMNLVDKD